MSGEEFGRLQKDYVVAFAQLLLLLLRTAPLHTMTEDDERLVTFMSTSRMSTSENLTTERLYKTRL